MTTFNTGNPVGATGSTDPRDLYDNSENFDKAINSPELTWTDRLGVVRRSMAGATGYENLGDYAAGLEFTNYNQILLYSGEFYRAAASTSLPFTTTGTWGTDEASLVSIGDAVLRGELGQGIRRVDTIASLRGISGRFAGDAAQPLGYYAAGDGGGGPVRVWKTGAAGTYTDDGGKTIIPTGGDGSGAWVWEWSEAVNARWYGAKGDGVTDDTISVQSAIDGFENQAVIPSPGATLYLPAGTYQVGTLQCIAGLTLVGDSSYYFGGTVVRLRTPNSTLINFVDAPQFNCRHIIFMGNSSTTEKGEDVSDIGINFNNTLFGDIDATFSGCTFAYFRDCVVQTGRNVKFNYCLFSNSKRGVHIPTGQPSDVRGLEMYGTRFHSMGKTGATDTGCVVIAPEANFQEVVLDGFDADDCTTLFNGFAGMTKINGLINKARDTGIRVTATGSGLSSDRRIFYVNIQYGQNNAETIPASAVYSDSGTCWLVLEGCVSAGSGGSGFDINSVGATVRNCVAHNAGQFSNNTYDAFRLTAIYAQLDNCSAYQDIIRVKTNKARHGFNVINPIDIQSKTIAIGGFSTSAYKDLSGVPITAGGGTKTYTLTYGSSVVASVFEISVSGTMGGSFSKSVGAYIILSFGLSGNVIQDVTINKTSLGDKTSENLSLSITAAGANNQVLITISNADLTNSFIGNVRFRELSSHGAVIFSLK